MFDTLTPSLCKMKIKLTRTMIPNGMEFAQIKGMKIHCIFTVKTIHPFIHNQLLINYK